MNKCETPENQELVDVLARMKPDTIKDIEKLQHILGAENRTDTCVRAVQLANLLIESMREGSQVLLESKGGKYEELFVPGVNM